MPKCDSKLQWNVHTLEKSNNYTFTSQYAVKSKDTFFEAHSIKFLSLQ